ncbi:hypothetical protein O181_103075 [Austropuccinia psidii MF-1]|uniref:Integrase catalytic domain-containing protein n=1 Tax=Austropuccinia psidii MF-1 TaxID=1389203 RepID=A0A9Q3PJE7_9BASI|nr:hypothetical protein [Austropuccinia psidii MF-1]
MTAPYQDTFLWIAKERIVRPENGGQCGKKNSEYCKTCEIFQKYNKSTGNRLGNMFKFQEPSRPWEIIHMGWLTGLPQRGDRSYNSYIFLFERFRNTLIFLPCHKDDEEIDADPLIWNRVVSWTVILADIISDRDTRFTSALWTKIYQLFVTKLSFSTAFTHKLMA